VACLRFAIARIFQQCNRLSSGIEASMAKGRKEKIAKPRTLRVGDREIITEGLHLNFWADISYRCMTASWPSFIGGAAIVFIVFNAIFALFYWIGDQPIANVPVGAYVDYLYFSIETLSTAGYGDMHPQTHYGHFIATVELFTGIFSMSLMTGLIFARFARPNARLLFAENPVISTQDGELTLMIRFANERNTLIGNATARLWLLRNEATKEGRRTRRFTELSLQRNESPALILSWTLYHVIDQNSPLYGLGPGDMAAANVVLVVVVSGFDEVTAQTVHARMTYEHHQIRHGHRYADIMENLDDGRLKVEYGRFHKTVQD